MDATYFLLLSSLGLVITTQAQNCTRPAGGENMNLKDSFILSDTFPDGTKVSFACAVGYMAAGGSPSITCTAGSWSPLRLKCERRNCGPAEEVLNGHVDYPQGTEFGDELVVICNDGFRLVGRTNKRLCGAQGWMGKMPECEPETCDRPPQVGSGTFKPDKDDYQYGEVVEYSCQKDYTLSGSKTRTCSANGMFDPAPPTCINVQCKDPVIANAEWAGGSRPPHGYQSTVTYHCSSGYIMIGESTLTCGIDSQWSPGLPTCQRECKEHHVANADRIGGQPPYVYQSLVTYKCKSGYKMTGEPTLTCGRDGQWSRELPKCQADTPVSPGNGGRSLALGLGIGLPVCIIALSFCGWYFCGFPCIKTKRGSRSGIPDNVVPKDGEEVPL